MSDQSSPDKPSFEKQSTALLEMLASRICHDIISPVGAINNGVEFMQEMGADASDEAIDLISYSATQAAAKLQAFRMAYGAGGKDPNIKPEDVQKAFSALITGEGKISQTWDPFGNLGPTPIPPGFCKILLCTMMLATEALPKGGRISVIPDGENTLVLAEGDDSSLRENTKESLEHEIEIDTLDPRLVHPYVIGMIADLYDFKISIKDVTDGKVTFEIVSPIAAEQTDDNEDGETEAA